MSLQQNLISSEWTADEEHLLARVYETGGIAAAAVLLPGRSHGAIYVRAQRLGLSRKRVWTEEEDARLRRIWSLESTIEEIAAKLNRRPKAVYTRAYEIGIIREARDGWESVTSAARRCGFDRPQFCRIMLWAGCTIRQVKLWPGPTKHRQSFVRSDEIPLALETWARSEPVNRAAARLGMSWHALVRRLRLAGIERFRPPGRPGRKKAGVTDRVVWRVLPEELAAAFGQPVEEIERRLAA